MTRLSDEIIEFLERQRLAHFASADASGQPHVVPICYAVVAQCLYFSIDEKPKRTSAGLRRIRNIQSNPKVSIIVDHYEEDWSRLGWVMLNGNAEVLDTGDEHARAQKRLVQRYHQLGAMNISNLPVVATRIQSVSSWGRLIA